MGNDSFGLVVEPLDCRRGVKFKGSSCASAIKKICVVICQSTIGYGSLDGARGIG